MKLTNKSRSAFMAVIISVLVFSCQPLDVDPLPAYLSEADMEGMIKLGKKLENPYTVENMQKAWENLKAAGRVDTDIDITTSHLYLKFMPKTEEELDILKSDSTLILYDYPLDVEIEGEGDFYHDPSIPIDQPTYQYVGVTVDQVLPDGVEYEVLAELFVPDEYKDGKANRVAGNLSEATVEALVNEALRITGNLEEGDNPEEGDNARITSSSWRPAGRIRVWDDQEGETRRSRSVFDHWEYYECDDDGFLLLLKIEPIEPCRRAVYRTEYYTIPGSYVPVQGVEVRARRWITTHEDYTDSNGYYSCNGTFKRDANYSIKWERYDFLIRDKWLSAATDNGPKKTGDWNNNYQGGVQEYYSHIFRATHHYYYKDINGLRRPPENSFWKTQLKIRANLEEDSDKCGEDDFVGCHSPGRRFLGLGNSIQMYSYNRSARDIYATMIHELAHASQWVNDHYYYQDKDDERKIAESWARGVEWNLTRMVYRNNYLGRARRTNDYTLVVADMIDGPATPDTRTNFGYIDSRDNVEGYTIRQIEDALNGQTTWNGWRNNIRNRYNNATKDNLDVLFSAYE